MRREAEAARPRGAFEWADGTALRQPELDAPQRDTIRRPKPHRRLKVGRLVLAVLVLYLGAVGVRAEGQVLTLGGQVTALTHQAQRLQHEEAALRARHALLKKPAYLEQLARTELGYVSKGEMPLVPRNSSGGSSSS